MFHALTRSLQKEVEEVGFIGRARVYVKKTPGGRDLNKKDASSSTL